MNAQNGVANAPPRLTPLPGSLDGQTPRQRSLSGSWSFVAAPPTLPPDPDADWRVHEVPGQWATAGYTVDESAGEVGWYRREFQVPTAQSGRTKLRFGAVYSAATVWVNGEEVGAHEGGYTPFELDVTDVVEPGPNRLSIAVREDSLAADLDWGNVTGGILRDVTLLSVPDVHLSRFHVETAVPDAVETASSGAIETEGRNAVGTSGNGGDATEPATVRAVVTVTNEGTDRVESPTLDTALTAPDGSPVASVERSLDPLEPGESSDLTVDLDVVDPAYWTPETPACYEATCGVTADGDRVEATRRTGIRSVTVDGNQLLLNGTSVTLRGVNWEEVDPDDGGVISAAQTRRDAERLRGANVNYVRPHTHPPTEAFLDACDDLGILVQVELPFTFLREETADRADDETYRDLMRRAALETVERDRSHPSVIVWSIANESAWGENFEVVSEAVTAADPTRPQTFNWAEYADDDAEYCAVGNHHYPEMRIPGPPTAADFEGFDRPMLFDEFAHLYCYNHGELQTDPGLRDDWGRFLDPIWEAFREVDAVAGGAIFAGIDHDHPQFRWGLLDVYRRERPEYWHATKVYAPVRATLEARTDDGLRIELENRQDFLPLDAHRIEWSQGEDAGQLAADVAPGESGKVTIPATPTADCPVTLRVVDDDGFVLDTCRFQTAATASRPADPGTGVVDEGRADGTIALDAGDGGGDWTVADETGRVSARRDGTCVLDGVPTPVLTPLEEGRTGPHRSAHPFDGRVDGWSVESVAFDDDSVTIEGDGTGVDGAVTLAPLTDGWVRLAYDLTLTEARSAREMGLALDLPAGHETIAWDREAQWSVYPDGHVGRSEGVATAFPTGDGVDEADPDASRPWAHDVTPRGSNDFRGAKRNVRRVSLTDDDGSGIALRADGDAHVRAAVRDDCVRLIVLARSLAGSGGEWFDRNATVGEDPDLSAGRTVRGVVDLRSTGD